MFCWVNFSRDFPEKFGKLYSPEEAFRNLRTVAKERGVDKLRISGAEPTLGKEHLLGLIKRVEESEFSLFILETNGILFGVDEDYVERLSNFNKVHTRVSIKAGTPEAFSKKTGAKPEAFELPFMAIRNLLKHGASFHVASMSADPRIMAPEERVDLIRRIAEIDKRLALNLEEELVDPYSTAITRLKSAGLDLKWPLKEVYKPIRRL